jgi:hypothetical protein
VNQISFSVSGYPPAKSEAKSMLSAGHQHATRVRLLLEAAERALREHAFAPVETEQIALDLVVHAAPGQSPWDATNYLGGVADVLEDKSRRGSLPHIGDLASVWLYRNDQQIKAITYREVTADRASYVVIVRRIDHEQKREPGSQSTQSS